jgi:23S rRNA pseudouridine2605 synthase
MGIRLQKYIAACGIASRRGAERLIREGKVTVNGATVREMGVIVEPEYDQVAVEGRLLARIEPFVYYMLNKPVGVLSTAKDDRGRRTVVDLLGNVTERVYPVGRLDYDSCGLLLLTNDGELAQRLIHPRYQVKKVYRVVVDGFPTKEDVNHWSQGVMLEDGPTLPARVERLRTLSGGTELLFELHEGRNRQIRRMCAALGYQVVSLCRIGMGPLTLGRLSAGRSRRLTDIELGNLRRAVGLNEA